MIQPLATITITRPWHWGVVVVSDPALRGQVPEVEPQRPVSFNRSGLVILVRHAQDQVADFEPGFDWAEATLTIRKLVEAPDDAPDQEVIFDGLILTPSAQISLGDADDEVVIPAHPGLSRVQVRIPRGGDSSPEMVWIDLRLAED